jgi:predicted aspartyl protease
MKQLDRHLIRLSRCALSSVISIAFLCMLADRAARASSPVPFKLMRHQLIVIPVSVNGAGPFDFLLDTGTDTTLIEPELAKQLGLRPRDRLLLTTVAGTQAVPRARLDRVAIGLAAGTNLEALITDLHLLRAQHPSIRGVLGQNFLSRFNYLLDYRRQRIEFETSGALGPHARGTRLPFEEVGGLIIVKAQSAAAAAKAWRLVLDSANPGLILFGQSLPESDFELDENGPVWVTTATAAGQREVRMGRLRALRVGQTTLADLPVTVMPPDGRAEDGLLPMSRFRAVYVNHTERYLILRQN